jgi:hypothetical protein
MTQQLPASRSAHEHSCKRAGRHFHRTTDENIISSTVVDQRCSRIASIGMHAMQSVLRAHARDDEQHYMTVDRAKV